MLKEVIVIILAYLIGSINPAFILGKLLKGIDIRRYGSKNAGTMNAFRVLGKPVGITTALFDLAKGILALYIASLILESSFLSVSWLTIAISFAAILGHDFPIYL